MASGTSSTHSPASEQIESTPQEAVRDAATSAKDSCEAQWAFMFERFRGGGVVRYRIKVASPEGKTIQQMMADGIDKTARLKYFQNNYHDKDLSDAITGTRAV